MYNRLSQAYCIKPENLIWPILPLLYVGLYVPGFEQQKGADQSVHLPGLISTFVIFLIGKYHI